MGQRFQGILEFQVDQSSLLTCLKSLANLPRFLCTSCIQEIKIQYKNAKASKSFQNLCQIHKYNKNEN